MMTKWLQFLIPVEKKKRVADLKNQTHSVVAESPYLKMVLIWTDHRANFIVHSTHMVTLCTPRPGMKKICKCRFTKTCMNNVKTRADTACTAIGTTIATKSLQCTRETRMNCTTKRKWLQRYLNGKLSTNRATNFENPQKHVWTTQEHNDNQNASPLKNDNDTKCQMGTNWLVKRDLDRDHATMFWNATANTQTTKFQSAIQRNRTRDFRSKCSSPSVTERKPCHTRYCENLIRERNKHWNDCMHRRNTREWENETRHSQLAHELDCAWLESQKPMARDHTHWITCNTYARTSDNDSTEENRQHRCFSTMFFKRTISGQNTACGP